MLSVIMALSTAMMFGCGEKSAFDGNYQEVAGDGPEMTALYTAHVDADVKEIAMGSGVTFKVDYKMTYDGESMTVKMTMNMLEIDGTLQMQGSMNMSMPGMNVTADIWYKDGYIYMNGALGGQTQKAKMQMTLEEFVGENTGSEVDTSLSFINSFEGWFGEEGVKIFIDDSGETKKVKFNIEDNSSSTDMDLYFLFDADYNLIGAKTTMSIESAYRGNIDTSVEMTAFKGTTLNFPSDLDSYIEMGW
jgi:hypothetical protein